MTFTQWMTLLAIVAGPFGVALGFALSMWGERVKALREANDKEHEQAVLRSLGVLAAADAVEAQGRTLAHAAYLQGVGKRPMMDQLRAEIDLFNSAMATLSRLTLEADVLGPGGLGDVGLTLQARARDLVAVVHDMNQRITSENVRKVQDESLPALETAIEAAKLQVRVLLKADTQSAPARRQQAIGADVVGRPSTADRYSVDT